MPVGFGFLLDIIVLMIAYIFISEKWKHESKGKKVLYTMMYIYVSFVLFFTLMPILSALPHINEHEYISMNMIPFYDYKIGRQFAKMELILNVIMFVPFGIMLPLIKNKKFIYVLSQIFIFTLAIELLQPLLHTNRFSDITDIITNVTGGIIGYIIYLIFKPILRKIFK